MKTALHPTQQALSDIVVYTKYAKYLQFYNRRETWTEIVLRYLDMMKEKYPSLIGEIEEKGEFLFDHKVLMSMRAAQFAGPAVKRNHSRIYNCSYLPADHYMAFSEIMFLLLGGTGVGYSVQFHHIDKLPEIRKPTETKRFIIGDSIEGWSDALKALMKSYFGLHRSKPVFDFSDIRAKGTRLVTAGGKAPGPEPLKICLFLVEQMLERKNDGEKLSSIEVHDIICHIADAVLAGGIRRAALISLFSADDDAMRSCKHGNWWELNPQRGRANNSAVLLRHKADKSFFDKLWEQIQESHSGEPGIYFSNDKDYGTNPCCEIALRPFSFCNLTEVNAGNLETEEDFYHRCRAAAFFGTLQAGFTDFHYLRDIWKTNTEKDALIGVGITGIANGNIIRLRNENPQLLQEGAAIVKAENERVAVLIGINKAARCTTIKPSGTTSCVLGTSSGIHAWHSRYYIRNMQCSVGDDLYNYFSINHPELIKVMEFMPSSAVIGIPQKAPEGAILRENETAVSLLERINIFNTEWVKAGHRSGQNTNNVSATISLKEEEQEVVKEWMWKNRHNYNGLSVLPYDGGTYKDAPFEVCDEATYQSKLKYIHHIDLTQIHEGDDHTTQSAELACAGGACELSH